MRTIWRRIRGTRPVWLRRYRIAAGVLLFPVFVLGLVLAQLSLFLVFGGRR